MALADKDFTWAVSSPTTCFVNDPTHVQATSEGGGVDGAGGSGKRNAIGAQLLPDHGAVPAGVCRRSQYDGRAGRLLCCASAFLRGVQGRAGEVTGRSCVRDGSGVEFLPEGQVCGLV